MVVTPDQLAAKWEELNRMTRYRDELAARLLEANRAVDATTVDLAVLIDKFAPRPDLVPLEN